MKIIHIESEAEAKQCFPIMQILRPKLDEEEFLKRFTAQKKENYQLIACVDEMTDVSALAGFRILNYMAWGKILYVDDLVTDPKKKRKGFGGALLGWMKKKAKEEGCDEIHLDTGYTRQDAHRLYLNKGFELSSHHLSMKLS